VSGPATSDKALYLIGYEKSGLAEFLATLAAAGVSTVVDVRDLPLSRRAGFSKRQLQAAVEEAGMGYVHLKPLGTPKEGRVAAHQGERERFWAIVERQLARPEAELALLQLADMARAEPCCLLCYEADHRDCHRLRVAEALEQRFGFTPRHLSIPGTEPLRKRR
jgi:uncharacterized protein (DUF488 family)